MPAGSPLSCVGLTRAQAAVLPIGKTVTLACIRLSPTQPTTPAGPLCPPHPIWRQAGPDPSNARGYPHTSRPTNNIGWRLNSPPSSPKHSTKKPRDPVHAPGSSPVGTASDLSTSASLPQKNLTSKACAYSRPCPPCVVTPFGHIPDHARNAFFGASLIAIARKKGGLRPIAIGSSYRRLVSKLVARRMTTARASQLAPTQLGVGTPLGCEAAVHAVRNYVSSHYGSDQVLVKLDLSNAFNPVHGKQYSDRSA
ncbi:hypothetical protein GWK47_006636 [Chionoecetes opilio]|uniref:Reverse transcriptase domain-containing protein n=1 Tax=Chionoecetes opilio TaxID=41210 RepID=A0A8J4YBD7_CHIOP|nr:hypothetical protein GWK47_006636 [Chionoecetes opilio]